MAGENSYQLRATNNLYETAPGSAENWELRTGNSPATGNRKLETGNWKLMLHLLPRAAGKHCRSEQNRASRQFWEKL
jgi:hypothetical protein